RESKNFELGRQNCARAQLKHQVPSTKSPRGFNHRSSNALRLSFWSSEFGFSLELWFLAFGISRIGGHYQIFTRLSGGRTIAEPSGTLNAFWNSGMFASGPFTRNCAGECGSVVSRSFWSSSRIFDRQIAAKERKKRCSGVSPSIFLSRSPGCLS